MKNTTMNALKFMDRWGNWKCLSRIGVARLLRDYGKELSKRKKLIPSCYECRDTGVDCLGGDVRGSRLCLKLRIRGRRAVAMILKRDGNL